MTAIPQEIAALGHNYRSAAGRVARQILGEGRTVAKAEEVAAISADYFDREAESLAFSPRRPPGPGLSPRLHRLLPRDDPGDDPRGHPDRRDDPR